MNHIVGLSGGKDSVAMALMLAEREPRDYEYICTPTGNEPAAMIKHWLKLGEILGKPIKPVTSGRSLAGLIKLQNALPNWRMRWCTRMLKIEPFERYIIQRQPCTVYIGIRADEVDRDGVDYSQSGNIIRDFPLQRFGVDLAGVKEYNRRRGVTIPDRTDCMGCFFQTLYEWWILWLVHPEDYAECESWEALTGHTLRSEQRDSHPAALKLLRVEFENGYVPKQRKMEDRMMMCSVCSR